MSDEGETQTLAAKLAAISKLESDIIRKGAERLSAGAPITVGHFYAIGILRRTLSQATGFRMLIEAKNFQSAAGLLRMQLDSAMRMYALKLADDPRAFLETWLDGKPINKLKSVDGPQLKDFYLRQKLAEEHPWVNEVYEVTSGFIHFSGKHFFTSIAKMDEESHVVHFQITATDPDKPESEYFEIVDAFSEATKLAAILAISYLYVVSGETP